MPHKRLAMALLIIVAMLLAAILPLVAGCAEPAAPATPPEGGGPPAAPPEEVIELKYLLTDSGQTPGGWMWKSMENEGWMARVEEATNGRVKFNYLVGAVTDPGKYDSLIAGAGDIANGVTLINPGRFPLIKVMCMPDLFTTCQRPSMVAWELWQKFPAIQQEAAEAKVIAMFATTPSPPGIGFATMDKKISTLEDTKGVKMGIYGEWATKTVAALGFTTVAVPPFEVYEAMQRGVVDGSFMDVNFLSDQNVGEIAKYWVSCSLQFCPFWFSMNWDSWNSLPPDIQKIMEDEAKKIPDDVDRYITIDKMEALAKYPEVEFVQIDEAEKLRWRERQDPVQEEYVNSLSAGGAEIHAEMLRLFVEYAEALP